jgi:hypothetical protein
MPSPYVAVTYGTGHRGTPSGHVRRRQVSGFGETGQVAQPEAGQSEDLVAGGADPALSL